MTVRCMTSATHLSDVALTKCVANPDSVYVAFSSPEL